MGVADAQNSRKPSPAMSERYARLLLALEGGSPALAAALALVVGACVAVAVAQMTRRLPPTEESVPLLAFEACVVALFAAELAARAVCYRFVNGGVLLPDFLLEARARARRRRRRRRR